MDYIKKVSQIIKDIKEWIENMGKRYYEKMGQTDLKNNRASRNNHWNLNLNGWVKHTGHRGRKQQNRCEKLLSMQYR